MLLIRIAYMKLQTKHNDHVSNKYLKAVKMHENALFTLRSDKFSRNGTPLPTFHFLDPAGCGHRCETETVLACDLFTLTFDLLISK